MESIREPTQHIGLQAQSTDCLVFLAVAGVVSPIVQPNQICTNSGARDPTLNTGVCIALIRQVGTDEYAQVTNGWWLGRDELLFNSYDPEFGMCRNKSIVLALLWGAETRGLERHLLVLHGNCKCRERQK